MKIGNWYRETEIRLGQLKQMQLKNKTTKYHSKWTCFKIENLHILQLCFWFFLILSNHLNVSGLKYLKIETEDIHAGAYVDEHISIPFHRRITMKPERLVFVRLRVWFEITSIYAICVDTYISEGQKLVCSSIGFECPVDEQP